MQGSDQPLGPDWWQASDGKWYAPQSAPPPPPEVANPSPSSSVPPTLTATPGPSPSAAAGGASGAASTFLRSLFDVSMSSFITPSIIKLLFIVAIVASGLVGTVTLVNGLSDSSGAVVLLALVLGPAIAFLGILYSRVLLEVIMVLFRIESNTRGDRAATSVAAALVPQPSNPTSPSPPGSTVMRTLGILAIVAGGLGAISPWLPFLNEDSSLRGSRSNNGWDTAEGLSNFERFSAGPALILLGSVAALTAGIVGTSVWRKLNKGQGLALGWVTMGGGAVVTVSSIATIATLQRLFDDLRVRDVGIGGGLGLSIVAGVAAVVVGIVGVVQASKSVVR